MRLHNFVCFYVFVCVFIHSTLCEYNNLVPSLGKIPSSCIHRVGDDFELRHSEDDKHLIVKARGEERLIERCDMKLQHGPAWKAWAQYPFSASPSLKACAHNNTTPPLSISPLSSPSTSSILPYKVAQNDIVAQQ